MHCDHEMCLCRVDAAEDVCSEFCHEMTGEPGHRDACRCGHDSCVRAVPDDRARARPAPGLLQSHD